MSTQSVLSCTTPLALMCLQCSLLFSNKIQISIHMIQGIQMIFVTLGAELMYGNLASEIMVLKCGMLYLCVLENPNQL